MKTIALRATTDHWTELRREGKRFLVKRYDARRIVRMKWFRNLAKAVDDFVDVCGLDSGDIEEIFHSENKGGEK